MDARLSAAASSYVWPLHELQNAGYAKKRLAILATARSNMATGSAKVYLPVRAAFDRLNDAAQVTDYYVVLISGDEVLSVDAWVTDTAGSARREILKAHRLAAGPFAPTYPVLIKIPVSVHGPGVYIVRLVAQTRLSGQSPLEFEMAHD